MYSRVEGIVVDMERLSKSILECDARRYKDLSNTFSKYPWQVASLLTVVRLFFDGGGTGLKTLKLRWSTSRIWLVFDCAETRVARTAKLPKSVGASIMNGICVQKVQVGGHAKLVGEHHDGYLNFLFLVRAV